jgi:hypothetical protein
MSRCGKGDLVTKLEISSHQS